MAEQPHSTQPVSAPSSANPQTAGAIAQSKGTPPPFSAGEEGGGAAGLSSMNQLKAENPKLYNLMMEGIAMNICNKMKRDQDHLKTLWRKMRNPQ